MERVIRVLKVRRTPIRRKEVIKAIEAAKTKGFEVELGKFDLGELVQLDGHTILLVDREPLLLTFSGGTLVPHLRSIKRVKCRFVVVDDGAVPHIMKGADVMAPGVVSHDEFSDGSVVVVLDKNGRAIAVGEATMSSNEGDQAKRGKLVRVVHRLNDELYQAVSDL